MQSPDQTNLSPLRSAQLYERIAHRIAEEIRVGGLEPGERLPSERELARRLGVGRSSLREAIAALAVDGVLETRPGAGSFVSADAIERVQQPRVIGDLGAGADAGPIALLEARLVLEPQVAALAASRRGRDPYAEELLETLERAVALGDLAQRARWDEADRLFHRQLAVMTANPVLIACAEHVSSAMAQLLWQRVRDDAATDQRRARLYVAEHQMIYEAITRGDGEAAAFHAREHLQRVRHEMALD